ncbi:hypothetical protein ACH5RR_013655 [Cinchona calisaya]|uniref:Uncharacterized protein n=1 Tax=Cinchona calisaya TaxID=153742 RepID=A0ABD3A156_9GENT
MNTAMLSLPRHFNAIPASISLASSQHHHVQYLLLGPIKSNSDNINGETVNNEGNASTPIPQPLTPPGTVEIRFRRGSRRRRKQQEDGSTGGQSMKVKTTAPKDWESMTLGEKAIELYMGEKGILFWLNKFAYASIFIIIGGWIVFRFVGPALNLYQLDSRPLDPTSIFKG